MVFRSKVDWWVLLIGLGIPGAAIAMDFTSLPRHGPPASYIVLPVLAAMFLFLAPIKYEVKDGNVAIRGGLLQWQMAGFPIGDIQSVRRTHNPLSAPALSLDRLKIELRSGGTALISPKDRNGFLRALAQLDPGLQFQGESLTRLRS